MILLAATGNLLGIAAVELWERTNSRGVHWTVVSTLDTAWKALVSFPVVVPASLIVGYVLNRSSGRHRWLTAITVAVVPLLFHPIGFALALRASRSA
jgi:hypothetical protein